MEYTLMQRDGFCRGCDKQLNAGTDKAVKFYSHRNRGQNIIICGDCVELMYEVVWNSVLKESGYVSIRC